MAEQEPIRVTKNLKGFQQQSNSSNHPSSGQSSSFTSAFGSSESNNPSRRKRRGSSGDRPEAASVAGPSTSSGGRKRSRSRSKKKQQRSQTSSASRKASKQRDEPEQQEDSSEDHDEVEEEPETTRHRRKPTPTATKRRGGHQRKKLRLSSASPNRSAGEEGEDETASTSGRSSKNTTRKKQQLKEERPSSGAAKSSGSRADKRRNSSNSSPKRGQSATVELEEEAEEGPRYPLRGRLATQRKAATSKLKTQPKPAQKRGAAAAAPVESSSEEDPVEEAASDAEEGRGESELEREAKDTSSASETEESKPTPRRAKRAKKDRSRKRKGKSSPSKKAKKRGASSSNGNTGTCASSSRGRASRTGGTGSGGVVSTGPGGGPSSSSDHHQQQQSSSSQDQAGPSAADNLAPGPSSAMNSSGGGLGSLFGGPSSAGAGTSAAGAVGGAGASGEDSDMGRLQALLESRGVPAHLFGALAPRVQNLIQRSIGATKDVCKAQQLLNSLQSSTDQSTQLQILIELCQLLVMGNEETLSGFPVKQAVPSLITLLNVENNFEIMHHACRALTYMMEALPRSSTYVVDAIPSFLEKVQVIQCMDVAEQSLSALDSLSRKHAKSILNARGVAACLMYLDFFSINAQRCALNIAANCCQILHPDDFEMVSGSLSLLISRLTHQDRRSVESVCLGLSRLVENCQSQPGILKQIGSKELLKNLQQLLVVSPPVVSQGTFIMIVRLLAVMCGACPDVAVELMRENIVETLSYLLTGSGQRKNTEDVELQSRSPQELFEIVSLIAELMPTLPETEPLFTVDAWMMKPVAPIVSRAGSTYLAVPASAGASVASADVASTSGLSVASTSGLVPVGGSARRDGSVVTWQWRHDDGSWHNYSAVDSGILEDAYLQGEDEISLSTLGRAYTVDFQAMQQINEDTGTTRNIMRRRVAPEDIVDNVDALSAGSFSATSLNSCGNDPDAPGVGAVIKTENEATAREDSRAKLLVEEQDLAVKFMKSLFGVVYQVYSSSAGPAVKHKCLRALLRMVYFASPELLKDVLKPQEVSSQLAGMLSSTDLKVLVGALQLASIFLQKLPHSFGIHFRREGVLHRVRNLKKGIGLGSTSANNSNSNNSGNSGGNNNNVAAPPRPQPPASHQQRGASGVASSGQSGGHGHSSSSSSKKNRKRGNSHTAPVTSGLLSSSNAANRNAAGSSRNGAAASSPAPTASQQAGPTSVPSSLASAINYFAQSYSGAGGDYNMAPAPPAYPHDLSQPPPPPLPSSAPPSLNGNEVATGGFAPFPPLPPPPPSVMGPASGGTSAILSVLPPPPPLPPSVLAPVPRQPPMLPPAPFRIVGASTVSCSDVSPMFNQPPWLAQDYRHPALPLGVVPAPPPPSQSHPALQHLHHHHHPMNSSLPSGPHPSVALLQPHHAASRGSQQYSQGGSHRLSGPASALQSAFNEFRASMHGPNDGHGGEGGSSSTPSAASSFLAHLNPSRWARAGSSRSAGQGQSNTRGGTSVSAPASVGSSASSIPVAVNGARPSGSASASPAAASSTVAARSSAFYHYQTQQPVSYFSQNKEKIKGWIMERAAQLEKEYEVLTETPCEDQPVLDISSALDTYWKIGVQLDIKITLSQAGDILTWLTSAVKDLRAARSENECIQSLKTIGAIVKFLDISPFEMTHSELITALLEFLTASDNPAAAGNAPVGGGGDGGNNNENEPDDQKPSTTNSYPTEPGPNTSVGGRQGERKRLRGATAAKVDIKVAPASYDGAHKLPPRMTRMRIFAHVFLGCSLDPLSSKPAEADSALIKCLVPKLIGCLHQVEQFAVRVHDLPGGNGANRNGASAIKFFNTHHLKCNLQRHPECTTLRRWKAGPVKIDPLALVSSVERYMVMKGYGRPRAAGYPDDDIVGVILAGSSRSGGGATGGPSASSSGVTVGGGGGGGGASSSAAAAVAAAAAAGLVPIPPNPPHDDDSDEDPSDDDLDDAFSAAVQSQGRHKLEFLVNGHVLPYSMTVYQAVRQYSHAGSARPGAGGNAGAENSETDTDSEAAGGGANLWTLTHTIYYRPYTDPDPPPSQPSSSTASNVVTGFLSGRCNKSGRSNNQAGNSGGHSKASKSGKGKGGSNADPLWSEGQVPVVESSLRKIPSDGKLPSYAAVNDPSLAVLSLLRAIYIINRQWGDLYAVGHYQPVIPTSEFISSKLTAKANRQLQDPLVIMTGNIPPWLHQIAQSCPFLFPFDTRQLLFYAVTFDRDRALHRLLQDQPELTTSSTDRVAPRLEKRKRTIVRDDILKQAENVINDVANSKALLEIEYENEVGTGLGPTLEFYTLVSRELQRFDLELWRGDKGPSQVSYSGHGQMAIGGSKKGHDSSGAGQSVHYVTPQGCGLFPMPLGRNVKPNVVAKQRAKFKFMGKLLGKAIMDSRMLDLPLNPLVYKWLKGETMDVSSLPPVPTFSSVPPPPSGRGNKNKGAAKNAPINAPSFADTDMAALDPDLARAYYQLLAVVQKKERLEAQKKEKIAAAGGAPDETPGSPKITSLDEIKEDSEDGVMDLDSIEDLGLDFTLPGHSSIELRKGGKDIPVTIHNLKQYLTLVRHWCLVEGVARQMDAFREGFESVFPPACLNLFFPEEMELLSCGGGGSGGTGAKWDLRTLMDCCRPDHGYTHDSRAVRWFFEILSNYDVDEQRKFLQFVTGSPCLPVGGFKSLSPPLTIVRKTMGASENPDDFLPSVMTCVNYLKLPDYATMEIMREKLRVAAMEGQYSFHLS